MSSWSWTTCQARSPWRPGMCMSWGFLNSEMTHLWQFRKIPKVCFIPMGNVKVDWAGKKHYYWANKIVLLLWNILYKFSSQCVFYSNLLNYVYLGSPRVKCYLIPGPTFTTELQGALDDKLDVSGLANFEESMVKPFTSPDPNRQWREGTKKNSFNYLLLDPRVTKNLPQLVRMVGNKAAFKIFVSAIFYVGKGKKSRAYAHFKEALKMHIQVGWNKQVFCIVWEVHLVNFSLRFSV